MSSETLHEDPQVLGPKVLDKHRAIASIMEELEAVDWYDQRVAATSDDELKGLLAHNSNEEREHAAMVIEWLRRNDSVFDAQLRTYLFSEGPILEVEEKATEGSEGAETVAGAGGSDGSGSLMIGSLRKPVKGK